MTKGLQRREASLELAAPGVIQELETLESALGGRDRLTGYLLLAPLTPDLKYLVGLLGDPANRTKTLAALSAQSNILPGEILRHVQAAALARGKALASVVVGAKIAGVVDDILKKAAPYTEACNGPCGGTGYLPLPDPTADTPNPNPVACPTCKGGGVLLYQPAFENQKLAVELAHLLPKGGGLNILNQQINANLAGSSGDGALEQLQHATDTILYGTTPVVDAELAEEDPTP